MRATLMYGAGDVRVETVPDPSVVEPTDAVIRVTHASVCGSDLWPYKAMEASGDGRPMGHEAIGVVEDVGADVRNVKAGDLVVMPLPGRGWSAAPPTRRGWRLSIRRLKRRTAASPQPIESRNLVRAGLGRGAGDIALLWARSPRRFRSRRAAGGQPLRRQRQHGGDHRKPAWSDAWRGGHPRSVAGTA
jgi:Alcohol dehydrogenase GroES-like domain